MGSIFYSVYFLKQPEVQCHHSVIIVTSTPVEIRNCHCLFLLRNENILAHVFLYKALFKAEQDSRCTTTGTKHCPGCARDGKHRPYQVYTTTDLGLDITLTILVGAWAQK